MKKNRIFFKKERKDKEKMGNKKGKALKHIDK
jgi:hypothetical protein